MSKKMAPDASLVWWPSQRPENIAANMLPSAEQRVDLRGKTSWGERHYRVPHGIMLRPGPRWSHRFVVKRVPPTFRSMISSIRMSRAIMPSFSSSSSLQKKRGSLYVFHNNVRCGLHIWLTKLTVVQWPPASAGHSIAPVQLLTRPAECQLCHESVSEAGRSHLNCLRRWVPPGPCDIITVPKY